MIHKAGPLVEKVQRCSRCGLVLVDYRQAQVPTGTPPLRGFPVHASIEVFNVFGEPRGTVVVTEKPNCK